MPKERIDPPEALASEEKTTTTAPADAEAVSLTETAAPPPAPVSLYAGLRKDGE